MSDLSESVLHEGIAVDLIFRGTRPEFGDLFTICGFDNPNFPPKSTMFAALGGLDFEQVDDYFGIKSESEDGDDVAVWLFPLLDGEEVCHEPGPFDGVRLTFNVLRHPAMRAARFVDVVGQMASHLAVQVSINSRNVPVEPSSLAAQLHEDIRRIQDYWRQQGFECGSDAALAIEW